MSTVEVPGRAGLIARVQAILLRPRTEWDVIDAEPATTRGLYLGYACILAAIPALAGLIGGQLFGVGAFGISFDPFLAGAIVRALMLYCLSLASVFVLALIIDALAPSFDGQKSRIQALKVAIYASTAGWVAGIFNLFPPLAILGFLCALYGFYLLYLGLPKLMKAPAEKALGYTVVTVIAAIVVNVLVFAVVAAIAGMAAFGAGVGTFAALHHNGPSGTVSVNGTNIDLARLGAAATAAAASAKAMQSAQADGKTIAVDPEKLKALLPASVAGLPRTEVSSSGVGGIAGGASNAEAVYGKDASRITLKISDIAMVQGLAAMAGALNVNANRETATGYEKTSMTNGHMTVEKWDRQSKSGEYSVIVAGRFAVAAEGAAASIDELKAAVAAVRPDQLEALAKG